MFMIDGIHIVLHLYLQVVHVFPDLSQSISEHFIAKQSSAIYLSSCLLVYFYSVVGILTCSIE
jgi:hypothetical protein